MKRLIRLLFLLSIYSFPAISADGMINIESDFNVTKTADRLENILKKKGMTVFNRIKHSQAASNVGIELRETELIIFGNPKVGSPLMKCQQSIAIDLPQKALIWKDEKSNVWISYNSPQHLVKRHQLEGCTKELFKIENALAKITKAAATKPELKN